MSMVSNIDWQAEIAKEWKTELEEGHLSLEQLLEWWPSKESWTEYKLESKKREEDMEIMTQIKHHYFNEDEFENILKRFTAKDAAARRKIFSLLEDKSQRPICIRAIAAYQYRSPSEKKMIRAFNELLKTEAFKVEILQIRKSIGLNPNGEKWKPHPVHALVGNSIFETLYQPVYDLAEKYSIDHGLLQALRFHIIFNQIPVGRLNLDNGLCYIEDVTVWQDNDIDKVGFFSENLEEDNASREHYKTHQAKMRERFPIAIRISSDAKISDVQSFLESYKARIRDDLRRHRKKAGTATGKFRRRPANKKHDFIWENQNVRPWRKLAEKVNKKFGTDHDAMYIRGTVSRLKKERRLA